MTEETIRSVETNSAKAKAAGVNAGQAAGQTAAKAVGVNAGQTAADQAIAGQPASAQAGADAMATSSIAADPATGQADACQAACDQAGTDQAAMEAFLNSVLSDEAKMELLKRNDPQAYVLELAKRGKLASAASSAAEQGGEGDQPGEDTPAGAGGQPSESGPAGAGQAAHEPTEEELQTAAEQVALENTFAFIRERSGEGNLTTYSDWEDAALAPEHLDSVAFTQLVFDTIIAAQDESARRAEEASAAAAQPTEAEAEISEAASPSSAEFPAHGAPAGPEPFTWELDDICVLEGKDTYLYSNAHMTDAYAHWAFLAAEDDDVLTLVDNARAESKIYPRPMLAASLRNRPYCLTDERIAAAFATAQESGLYPDIQTCSASNGDAYCYSTDFLSTAQAKALAEWFSVERGMNV